MRKQHQEVADASKKGEAFCFPFNGQCAMQLVVVSAVTAAVAAAMTIRRIVSQIEFFFIAQGDYPAVLCILLYFQTICATIQIKSHVIFYNSPLLGDIMQYLSVFRRNIWSIINGFQTI